MTNDISDMTMRYLFLKSYKKALFSIGININDCSSFSYVTFAFHKFNQNFAVYMTCDMYICIMYTGLYM